ncbi:16S rRNA (cytosine(1402)-N(4))-methyltransferase RsmH, partial [Patescibacteria group bacterium]|nr:16S rRNA (cytosine(1402)-N(4))-methyltransferase RsmH [Patescibacteria group bacterium]
GGGYTMVIAERIKESGRVLAIDLDETAINNFQLTINNYELKNVVLVNNNFKNLKEIVVKYFVKNQKFSGIVFDLGLSSAQLDDKSRGFSFKSDAPLDMNYESEIMNQELGIRNQELGMNQKITVEKIINQWRESELIKIIKEYGEERCAKSIAREIVKFRKLKPIKTTGQLVEIIKNAVPKNYEHYRIHPATRTFQALRIASNNELENLKIALPQALELLQPGGRIVVISFHSLEDRIVKQFFKQESKECICPSEIPICRCDHQIKLKIITKKVVRPSAEEVLKNPRARSAKMRVAELSS